MITISTIKPRENWSELAKDKTGRCLDLGCGFGADAFWFANAGWRVDAIDTEDTLKFHHANINFIQQDLKNIDFDKFGKYDFIIACFTLHFLKPKYSFSLAKKLISMLNSKGILYIKTFEKFFTSDWQKLFRTARVYKYIQHDDHPPEGKHVHHVVKIIFEKT
jgi:2-polyprenyl-3-methyl-5-hydroxy-6-metoxy-1,4-benzoquinol methylase